MIRGTTPILEFDIPFETDLLQEAFITFSQDDNIVIDKKLSDCTIDGKKIILKLSQEETLRLSCDSVCQIQIRTRTLDETSSASDIIKDRVYPILKDGVI